MANETQVAVREEQSIQVMDPRKEAEIAVSLKKLTQRILALSGNDFPVNQLQAAVVLAVARNPYLMDASVNRASLVLAVLQAAREGITVFSGSYAGGYLVPFKGKVTLVHNYKFLIDTALECGAIQGLRWGVVREKDEFDYEDGSNPFVKHKKFLAGDRGGFLCTWAQVTLPGGEIRIDVCDREYHDKVRQSVLDKITDKTKEQFSPWVAWVDEMLAKTAIRHILKTCGLNFDRHARLISILDADDRAVSGEHTDEFKSIAAQLAAEEKPEMTAKDKLEALALKGVSGE